MLLFKTKIPADQYLAAKWDFVFAPEREQMWDAFRTAANDPALNAADTQILFENMRALYLELFNIVLTKTLRMNAAHIKYTVAFHNRIKDQPNLNHLVSEYASAFGHSLEQGFADGVIPMLHVFNANVAGGKLKAETLQQLHAEFYSIIPLMRDDLKKFKLVP